jgi:hypothetical protein
MPARSGDAVQVLLLKQEYEDKPDEQVLASMAAKDDGDVDVPDLSKQLGKE